MESLSRHALSRRAEEWIGLALCAAVLSGWAVEQLVPDRPDYARIFAPDWLPIVASGLAAAGIIPLGASSPWRRVQRYVRWGGLLLMVWAANGLPLDVLRVVSLIPLGVDWPGLATRAWALAAAVVVARALQAGPPHTVPAPGAAWYGYAAFVLALPYPVLRTHWALGGTLGLKWAGAGGQGWEAWLFSVPWLMAAALSLLLVSPPRWIPRRLLLAGGWSATAIVAMIGPAGCWAFIAALMSGSDSGPGGIETWVFALFYGSWLLWAIAAAAATRAYQVRSASPRMSSPM